MKSIMNCMRLAALFLALGISASVAAQPVQGKDYLLVKPAQPVDRNRKVEVLEFFWYACPACNHLQAPLHAWLKQRQTDIDFKRQPAAFHESWLQLARTYYALEAMGLVEKLHGEVFAAIHEKKTLDPKTLFRDPKPLFDWVAARGVDRQKFIDVYQSFSVNNRTQRTMEVTGNYDVDGTPTIIIAGKYLTKPSLMLTPDKRIDYDRYFLVVDQLVAMARKNGEGK
jgi:protein dithiol oxidoreductase (disulfide-forming)